MGSIHDFQGRLASFVQSQHITIYDDQLALAGQIWEGLSPAERQIPQVIEYITLGVFQQLDRSIGLENTKKMICADAKVDERLIHQIKKMALLRGLDRWQSSGSIEIAKQRIIAAYEEGSTKLSLFNLRLSSLPAEIGQLTALTELTLRGNNLSVLPPEIGQLRALNYLDISVNKLKSLPPEIEQLTGLIRLDLYKNQLTALPSEIGQLKALTLLYISENQLTSLPISMGLLRNLHNLVLSHNPLRELPLSLGQLQLLALGITGTQISEEVVQRILAQCKAKRDVEASTLLPAKLVAWKAIAGSDIDLSLLDPLTKSQKLDLFEWLIRLEKTRDFSNNQKNLAKVACDILKDVLSNKEFQEVFFKQVEANNRSSENRAAISFNEIFVSWKIICASPNATLKDKLSLLASAAKTSALRPFLDFAIDQRAELKRESVEIYLYYEFLLKDELQLFTFMDEIRYGQIGKWDCIDKGEIIQYVRNGYFTYLFDIPIFKKLFENDLATKDEIKKINELYQAKLEALPPPKGDVEQALHPLLQEEIQEEKKRALIKCAKEWFDRVIGK